MGTELKDRTRAAMAHLLRAFEGRLDQARSVLSTDRIAELLASPDLPEHVQQSVRGLDKCPDALQRYRYTLFARTLLQDHQYNREQMIEACAEIFDCISRENPLARATELPRIDFTKISADEFFETYVKRPQPVVLENVGHDPTMYRLEALVARYGADVVPMMSIESGASREGPLSELLEGRYYLANSDRLFVNHPELAENLHSQVFARYTRLTRISSQLFISNHGAGSPSHFGKIANTFYQLEGRKRWSLVDPAFMYLVYPLLLPGDAVTALHWQDESDYERCPLFRYCPRYETVLSPGDVLWNPYYWFHSVKNLTRSSVAVADRWFGVPGKDFQSSFPLYDLATSVCAQSIDLDMFIQWVIIQQNVTKKQIPWYEQVSHGRRYQAFDSAHNARAWGLSPPDLAKGVFHHTD
jgi:Cupin-like domain